MTTTISPLLQELYTQLTTFFDSWLPDTVDLVQGIDNRVPAPAAPTEAISDYIVMTAMFTNRLRTNIESYPDDDEIAGPLNLEQGVEMRLQVDCYGPDSNDLAQTFTTLWRDEYGCNQLTPVCQPLYADEARMMPLTNEELQWEQRWLVDARLQYNATVTVQQQYANALKVTLINAEVLES